MVVCFLQLSVQSISWPDATITFLKIFNQTNRCVNQAVRVAGLRHPAYCKPKAGWALGGIRGIQTSLPQARDLFVWLVKVCPVRASSGFQPTKYLYFFGISE